MKENETVVFINPKEFEALLSGNRAKLRAIKEAADIVNKAKQKRKA